MKKFGLIAFVAGMALFGSTFLTSDGVAAPPKIPIRQPKCIQLFNPGTHCRAGDRKCITIMVERLRACLQGKIISK